MVPGRDGEVFGALALGRVEASHYLDGGVTGVGCRGSGLARGRWEHQRRDRDGGQGAGRTDDSHSDLLMIDDSRIRDLRPCSQAAARR